MILHRSEDGYTIVEIIVTLFIMGIFLTVFFQLYLLTDSQRVSATRVAAANDLAQTNLRKITKKNQIQPAVPPTGIETPATTCNSDATIPGDNQNNIAINPNASGSDLKFENEIVPPELPPAGTANGTRQYLKVKYVSKDCNYSLPAEIISTVTYGTETVTRASYVSN